MLCSWVGTYIFSLPTTARCGTVTVTVTVTRLALQETELR